MNQIVEAIDFDTDNKNISTKNTGVNLTHVEGDSVVVTWQSTDSINFWVNVGKRERQSELVRLQKLLDK